MPLERNFVEAYLRKKARYAALKTDLRLKKWAVIDHTWEIGTLGFISKHTYFFHRSLGFSNSQRKHLCKQMSKVALRSSYYIWMARHTHTFAPPCLVARPKPPEIKIWSPPPTPKLNISLSSICSDDIMGMLNNIPEANHQSNISNCTYPPLFPVSIFKYH